MIGTTISHYRVLEKLGGGGMGVVYRAEDVKLRRPVAIKVLPADLTRDEDAKRRFVFEAQAASALDHPNICTIYEIDETPDGQLFLVLAYYDGETLKKTIERGPLKLDDALEYAIQIAQGLVKAHAAGIVHRDIKPANALVTTDGLVKIVDFGIAKLLGQTAMTQTGTMLGTLAYMSPEQLTGPQVDARTDLWSLGVVLYEMIAGQVPFRGEHQQTVADAIAHATPAPLTALRTGVPMDLERGVTRALAKRPDDRYQTATDLLSELRRIKRESDRQASAIGQATQAGRPSAARKMPRVAVWTVGAMLVAAALGYLALHRSASGSSVPTLANPVLIAGSVGIEIRPAWSPDGHMLAYQSDQAGKQDIWVAQIGGGPAINRTADFSGNAELPRWSPDGRQIAFWSTAEGGGIFLMPALAGKARKIAATNPGVPLSAAFSPDGSELAYYVGDARDRWMERLDLRNGTTRKVELPGDALNRLDLTWSPDARFVAYVTAPIYTSQVTRLWILNLKDGKAHAMTDGRMVEWSPTWSPDSRTLYFSSNRGGTMDLWHQRVTDEGAPLGAAERVTTGVEVLEAALAPDGKRLAYSKGRKIANVWRVPIFADRAATWADARQITFDQAHIEYFDLSDDGQRLAVQSDHSGNPDVWILPATGGEMQQLTTDPTPDWAPAWSPDGREIAFYAYRSGQREIWVQPVAGGPARQLTRMGGAQPRWSPDGTLIFFGLAGAVWAVPSAGGEPRQVLEDPTVGGSYVMVSPDGRWLAFPSRRSGELRIWRSSATGGEAQLMLKGQGTWPLWSPDGKWLYFRSARDGPANYWRLSLDDKSERPVTNLVGRRGFLGDMRTDGQFLYFTWREDIADIWVMDFVGGATR